MKTEQVPQDDSPSYSGHKKLIYAVNDKGHYSGIQSTGWEVENFATQMAVEELNQQTQTAISDFHAGKVSALAFHMCQRRFDIVSLAQSTGFFQWQIRRHLKPSVFAGLSQRKLNIYSEVLSLSIAQLSTVPKHP